MTVRELCTRALQRIGVVAAGADPAVHDLQLALDRLNLLVSSWRTQRLFTYALTRTLVSVTANDPTITIGPGGDVPTLARPVFLDRIRLVDTSQSPIYERALTVLSDAAYAALPQKTLTSLAPTHVYYNATAPLATVTLWPVPTGSTYQLALYTPNESGTLALSDDLEVPAGYELFYQEQLALHLTPDFERQPSAVLVESAREAKAAIKGANLRLEELTIRTPWSSGWYDIHSDQTF
jgi:hypothetical protein